MLGPQLFCCFLVLFCLVYFGLEHRVPRSVMDSWWSGRPLTVLLLVILKRVAEGCCYKLFFSGRVPLNLSPLPKANGMSRRQSDQPSEWVRQPSLLCLEPTPATISRLSLLSVVRSLTIQRFEIILYNGDQATWIELALHSCASASAFLTFRFSKFLLHFRSGVFWLWPGR